MVNAIIMAGGYGTRLKPLTDFCPKPMLSVCNLPVLDYSVAQLNFYGIRDIVLSLAFMPEKIIEWTAGYRGIKMHYSVENAPLGTLGGVKLAADRLNDIFVVVSGDGINDINLNAMLNRHLATKAEATIAIKRVDNPALYGLVEAGEDGLVKSFTEKPHGVTSPSFVNCGTYVISKKALDLIDKSNSDFARDLFPLLVSRGSLAFYEHHGYWQDVGDFASLFDANFDMLSSTFFPRVGNDFDESTASRYLQKAQSLVSKNARISGNIFDSIVGRDCVIGADSALNKCVVMDGAEVHGRHTDCIIYGENKSIFVNNLDNYLLNQAAKGVSNDIL